MGPRIRVLSFVAIVACNPDVATTRDSAVSVDTSDGARSGTRLKLRWYTFADGTRHWEDFFDVQRNEVCEVLTWADGKRFCVPPVSGTVSYSDAGCSARVVRLQKTACARAPYVREHEFTGCNQLPVRLWTRAGAIPAAPYYLKMSDGMCSGPYMPQANDEFFAVGSMVPTSELQEVTLGPPEGTGRLAVRYYESSDGMRRQAWLHDATLDDRCFPADRGVCTPNASEALYAHDASCTQPKIGFSKLCAVPKFVDVVDRNACPAVARTYYEVGPTVSSAPLYRHNGTSCAMQTPLADQNYYVMGNALQLEPITRSYTDAGTRLKLQHYALSDGTKYRDPALYDPMLEESCTPTVNPDGSVRCFVDGGSINTYYTTSACTTTIDLISVNAGPSTCGPPTPPRYARRLNAETATACPVRYDLFRVGAAYTGPVYNQSGGCELYTPPGRVFYTIGAPLPLDELAAGSITVDP